MTMVLRALALTAVLFGIPALAHADAADCTKTLGKEVPKLIKSRGKGIAKCENSRAKGKLAPTTVCRPQCGSAADNAGEPCRADSDCACSSDPNNVCAAGTCQAVSDMKTSDKLAKASTKSSGKITSACGTLPPLGPGCDSATDAAGLADCLTAPRQDNDLEQGNADTLMRALYSATVPDATLVKCQGAISKNVQKYLSTRMKVLAKCHSGIASGKVTGACPDSDTQADI